jgi:hypothetical protein
MNDNTPLTEKQIAYLKENKREEPALGLKSSFIPDNYAEQFRIINKEKVNPWVIVEDGIVITDKEEIDSWLNEEPTKLPRGLTREEKRKHIIDSNKKGED